MSIEILRGVVGSHAYGLAHKDSDVDIMAIHVDPTLSLAGLGKPPPETVETKSPDSVSHELGKYLRLALAGNPSILEFLWLDTYVPVEPNRFAIRGSDLVSIRESFLSQNVRRTYLGYADSQFKRLSNYGRFSNVPTNRIEKNARHLLRLVEQAIGIWVTGKLTVRVDNPAGLRDRAKFIATDPKGPDWALKHIAAAATFFDDTPTELPERPDTRPAADLLWAVRRTYLEDV